MSSLTSRELNDIAILHLRDGDDELMYADGPDGEPDLTKPQRIHLYGPGTKQQARANADRNNRFVDRLQRKGKSKLTADEAIKERAEFVASITKAFENIDSDAGAIDNDLYMEVYLNPRLSYIPEQAELFARNTANFTKGSAKPSP